MLIHKNLQVYSWRAEVDRHLGGGTFTLAHGSSLLDIIRIGDKTTASSNGPIAMGVLMLSAISVQVALVGLPPNQLFLNLDRFHESKLLIGVDYEYILINWSEIKDFNRGIILTPKVGIQTELGLFKLRLMASYSHFWCFNRSDQGYGLGISAGLFYGSEFMF